MALAYLDDDTRRVRPVEVVSEWTLGLDLGQLVDPTALSVVEWRRVGTGEWSVDNSKVSREASRERLMLRYLERVPLRTSYVDIVSYISEKLQAPPFSGKGYLVVDQTGVGRPVVDLFRSAGLQPIAVTMTGGDSGRSIGNDEHRIPKTELINLLDAKLHAGDLEVAHDLPDLDAFEKELQDFRRRISGTGHVSFSAREGRHDDLVLSVSLAVWWASRKRYRHRMFKLRGW